MSRHLLPAMLLLLPASLFFNIFVHSSAPVQQTAALSMHIERQASDFTDSIPVEKKAPIGVMTAPATKTRTAGDSITRTGMSPYRYYEPIKWKGNFTDTAGFIYDLNAFYYLGK